MVKLLLMLLMAAVVVEDLKQRTIDNRTVLLVFAVSAIYRIGTGSWKLWIAGTVVAVIVCMLLYLQGGIGGGDVKLLMALGGYFGPTEWLMVVALACIYGVIGGFAWMALRNELVPWMKNIWCRLKGKKLERIQPEIPFGPAIAIAVVLSLYGPDMTSFGGVI